MLNTVRTRLSYSNVTATLALFVALSGSAYAAIKLPPDSVGPVQLRDNAVSSPKVQNGSLLASDFKAGQLPAGPKGPAGSTGPAGPAGPQGPAGGLNGLEVIYAASVGGAFTVKSAEAHCPPGKKVTGGGHVISGETNARAVVSAPGAVPNPTSWYVQAVEPAATGIGWTLYAYAVCANVAS
ncbi:hypothetical protein [Baekduia sp. Peel2402]|uniref:hypothetical protein n=1 Tax=Baekduia sp. Peel2402 TaxID=3458296 RepID=UPI00403ED73F